jgi:integrase
MAVYKPKRKGETSKYYITEFVYQGKRFQESTGATSKTVAKEYEKRRKAELERAAAGLPTEQKANRIRTVAETAKQYLEGLQAESSRTYCLRHVESLLGGVMLSDLTEAKIRRYIEQRQEQGASGRTINMELANLSRAMGHPWSVLWPKVRKLEERQDVGRALSVEEQTRLLATLKNAHTPHVGTLIPLLLLTGTRSGGAMSLTWGQVDLFDGTLTVGRAKTSSGRGRVIPINGDLAPILLAHRSDFVRWFGEPLPTHFVFAWGSPWPCDPTRPVTGVKHAWETLRAEAAVSCRLHDLRHTFATRLAEAGVPESTMLALMGHMSRAMLERYSHIRMAAKREALAGIRLHVGEKGGDNSEVVPVKVPVLSPHTSIQ